MEPWIVRWRDNVEFKQTPDRKILMASPTLVTGADMFCMPKMMAQCEGSQYHR